MTWMTSRYQDKPRVCAICGEAIDAGYPRMYSPGTGVSAHVNCVPTPTAQPTPIPRPEGAGMSDAARGHQENMESAEKTRLVLYKLVAVLEAINALQATSNELLAKEVRP